MHRISPQSKVGRDLIRTLKEKLDFNPRRIYLFILLGQLVLNTVAKFIVIRTIR